MEPLMHALSANNVQSALRLEETAHILIVDDEPANVLLLDRVLKSSGFQHVHCTFDSREVLPFCENSPPDIILLDLMMPHMSGFDVMKALEPVTEREVYLPILVLTADANPKTRQTALASGAKDFLTKPLDPPEVVLRVKNLLETRRLYQRLQGQNLELEDRVRERTQALQAANTDLSLLNAHLEKSQQELEESQVEILQRLARAAEFRDDDTGQHTQRVGQMSARIAEALNLGAACVELMLRAAPLHDVGKIGISDTILLKPGRLTPAEFEIIKTHAVIGAALLADGHSALVQTAQRIALSHHERWDGTGYPHKLAGDDIPLEGRILAIADVWDALTHERPYKKAWAPEQAMIEIQNQSGKQFDPAVVEAFLPLAREVDDAC